MLLLCGAWRKVWGGEGGDIGGMTAPIKHHKVIISPILHPSGCADPPSSSIIFLSANPPSDLRGSSSCGLILTPLLSLQLLGCPLWAGWPSVTGCGSGPKRPLNQELRHSLCVHDFMRLHFTDMSKLLEYLNPAMRKVSLTPSDMLSSCVDITSRVNINSGPKKPPN